MSAGAGLSFLRPPREVKKRFWCSLCLWLLHISNTQDTTTESTEVKSCANDLQGTCTPRYTGDSKKGLIFLIKEIKVVLITVLRLNISGALSHLVYFSLLFFVIVAKVKYTTV